MMDNKYLSDLFLQAFARLQQRPCEKANSYFQIAGIHGMPFEPYDGVGALSKDTQFGGYCWHGSVLFPTWHRPYMMLMDQELRSCASELLESWKQQYQVFTRGAASAGRNEELLGAEFSKHLAEFEKAYEQLLFPYLDWASQTFLQEGPPKVLMAQTVFVRNLSHGDSVFNRPKEPFMDVEIPNPLRAYVLPVDLGEVQPSSDLFNPHNKPNYKVPLNGFMPFTPKGYHTVRYPTPDYESNAGTFESEFQKAASQILLPRLSAMFSVQTWAQFSTHSKGTHSLEGVHDQVHNAVGGNGGHMYYPEVSSYDPAFWLHHMNVDRLLALWQAVYDEAHPDNASSPWLTPTSEETDGTFTHGAGSITVTEKTDLEPFRIRKKAFWTSKDVRTLKSCGYTFKELDDWRDRQLSPAEILSEINTMYPAPGPATASEPYLGYRVWAVFPSMQRLQAPYQVRVYVCTSEDGITADTAPAGTIALFTNSHASRCAGCQTRGREFISGSVDLTAALLSKEQLPKELFAPEAQTFGPPDGWESIKAKIEGTVHWAAVMPCGDTVQPVLASVGKVQIHWSRAHHRNLEEIQTALAAQPAAADSRADATAAEYLPRVVQAAAAQEVTAERAREEHLTFLTASWTATGEASEAHD